MKQPSAPANSSPVTRSMVALLPVALSACASPAGDYPSLAIRDAERVSGTMAVPEAAVPESAQPGESTRDRIAALAADARAAHDRFLAAASSARVPVNNARNAGVGSEAWSRAQVALADLESIRSAAMIALADLDQIYVDAATTGQSLEPVADTRSEIAALVEQQDRLIAEMLATLTR